MNTYFKFTGKSKQINGISVFETELTEGLTIFDETFESGTKMGYICKNTELWQTFISPNVSVIDSKLLGCKLQSSVNLDIEKSRITGTEISTSYGHSLIWESEIMNSNLSQHLVVKKSTLDEVKSDAQLEIYESKICNVNCENGKQKMQNAMVSNTSLSDDIIILSDNQIFVDNSKLHNSTVKGTHGNVDNCEIRHSKIFNAEYVQNSYITNSKFVGEITIINSIIEFSNLLRVRKISKSYLNTVTLSECAFIDFSILNDAQINLLPTMLVGFVNGNNLAPLVFGNGEYSITAYLGFDNDVIVTVKDESRDTDYVLSKFIEEYSDNELFMSFANIIKSYFANKTINMDIDEIRSRVTNK